MKGVKRFAKTVDVALGTVVTPCKRWTSPAETARAGLCAKRAVAAKNSLSRAKSRPHRRCGRQSHRRASVTEKSANCARSARIFRSSGPADRPRLKSLPQCADLLREEGQRDLGRLDLRVPHLLPFETEPAVIAGGLEEPRAFLRRELAAAKEDVVGLAMAAHQCVCR